MGTAQFMQLTNLAARPAYLPRCPEASAPRGLMSTAVLQDISAAQAPLTVAHTRLHAHNQAALVRVWAKTRTKICQEWSHLYSTLLIYL